MSEEAKEAVTQVKVEPDDEVEPYDGSYACGFCSESVQGTVALKCSQCSSNPVHWAHVSQAQNMLCGARRVTVRRWRRGGARAAGPPRQERSLI